MIQLLYTIYFVKNNGNNNYILSKSFKHFFYCYYIPTYEKQDIFSKSILEFKNNNKNYVDRWVSKIKEKFTARGLKYDYIVRVLRSNEAKDSGTGSLSILANELAGTVNGIYLKDLLKKTRYTTKLSYLRKYQREMELKNVYYLNPEVTLKENSKLLLIDDIITSGTTIKTIISLLIDLPNPPSIDIFSIAIS